MTSGIISGLHRSRIGIEQFENFIQTDAAVYPGNSGRSAVRPRHSIMAVNTAFIGASGGGGLNGFRHSDHMAPPSRSQIVTFGGNMRHSSLRLTFDDLPPDALRDLKLTPPDFAAVITKVDPGSPGQRAGLKAGDVVTEIGERAVVIGHRVALLRVGEVAELAVMRAGQPM